MEWPADKVARRLIAELVPYARNARTHNAEQAAESLILRVLPADFETWVGAPRLFASYKNSEIGLRCIQPNLCNYSKFPFQVHKSDTGRMPSDATWAGSAGTKRSVSQTLVLPITGAYPQKESIKSSWELKGLNRATPSASTTFAVSACPSPQLPSPSSGRR
jgi:hypothetical protein